VIGLDKLKKKYNTFETKRQLLAEYDIFLGDDRIVSELPRILGKVFLSHKAKRPIPVSLTMQLPKDKDGKRKRIVRKPEEIAKDRHDFDPCRQAIADTGAVEGERRGCRCEAH
jgi:ribosome biogenesis protein UTP30